MENYTTIRRFNTKNFSVIVDAAYDDADLSYMDADEIRRFHAEGGAFYLVRCRVLLDGAEIASNYLGGCDFYDIREFQDHRECAKANRKWAAAGEARRRGSYFADMVKRACAEARKEVNSRSNVKLRNVA